MSNETSTTSSPPAAVSLADLLLSSLAIVAFSLALLQLTGILSASDEMPRANWSPRIQTLGRAAILAPSGAGLGRARIAAGLEAEHFVVGGTEGLLACGASQRLAGLHGHYSRLLLEVDVDISDAVDGLQVPAYTRSATRGSSHTPDLELVHGGVSGRVNRLG